VFSLHNHGNIGTNDAPNKIGSVEAATSDSNLCNNDVILEEDINPDHFLSANQIIEHRRTSSTNPVLTLMSTMPNARLEAHGSGIEPRNVALRLSIIKPWMISRTID